MKNFWALNAYSSKMANDTDFRFGMHAPRDSLSMTPEKFFVNGVSPGSRDCKIFRR